MDNKRWPSEEFLPMFKIIEQRFRWRKTTSRRIARITKGVLAAKHALSLSMSDRKDG